MYSNRDLSSPSRGELALTLIAVFLFSMPALAATPFEKALNAAPAPAASSGNAMLFSLADIVIHPLNLPSPQGEVSIIRPDTTYNVEVRSEEALKLEYIHTLNTLSDTGGIMIVLDRPSITPLPRMQVFTPVDAVFVTAQGEISAIVPGAVLGNLPPKVQPDEPIKAILFLKNGQAMRHAIKPHDTIRGSMFTPPVMVQE